MNGVQLAVTCPYCGEVCELPPVYADTVMVFRGLMTPLLSLRLGEIPSVAHVCTPAASA